AAERLDRRVGVALDVGLVCDVGLDREHALAGVEAPSSMKRFAVALPMPPEPPVMTMVLSCMRFIRVSCFRHLGIRYRDAGAGGGSEAPGMERCVPVAACRASGVVFDEFPQPREGVVPACLDGVQVAACRIQPAR